MISRLALRLNDDVLAVIDVSPRARRDLAEFNLFPLILDGDDR